jgi:hypothetical protein
MELGINSRHPLPVVSRPDLFRTASRHTGTSLRLSLCAYPGPRTAVRPAHQPAQTARTAESPRHPPQSIPLGCAPQAPGSQLENARRMRGGIGKTFDVSAQKTRPATAPQDSSRVPSFAGSVGQVLGYATPPGGFPAFAGPDGAFPSFDGPPAGFPGYAGFPAGPGFTGPPGIFSGFAFLAGSPGLAGPGEFPGFAGFPTGAPRFTSAPGSVTGSSTDSCAGTRRLPWFSRCLPRHPRIYQ